MDFVFKKIIIIKPQTITEQDHSPIAEARRRTQSPPLRSREGQKKEDGGDELKSKDTRKNKKEGKKKEIDKRNK